MASNVNATKILNTGQLTTGPKDLQYAPGLPASASRFVVRFVWPGGKFWAALILVSVLVSLFVKLGLWQWEKAVIKASQQALLDERARASAVSLSGDLASLEDLDFWRYRRVTVRGVYDTQRQVLLDNRVYRDRAGYHVLTPLRLVSGAADQPNLSILVNRGWVPAMSTHADLPKIQTPSGELVLSGTLIVPGSRFFVLGKEANRHDGVPLEWGHVAGGFSVWQNLDMQRYRRLVKFPLLPMVLQLDAGQAQGGAFVCDWPRPDDRLERHWGYALQWFGFAGATLVIALFFALRRLKAWRERNAPF